MKKVFLNGIKDGSKWRDDLIPQLEIEYYNPDIPNKTEEQIKNEENEKQQCDYCLYVVTPMMQDLFTIVEVTDDSNKRKDKVLFCYLAKEGNKEFTKHQIKSLNAVGKMIEKNGGKWLQSLNEAAEFLNAQK